MNNDYIKIKNCLDESILIQINELSYMQNLRNGIEFYEESKTNKFFDSIMEYILLNDIDLKFKKFIVFWIDYVIQNYSDLIDKSLRKKLNDIIITLDIFPLLYDKDYYKNDLKFFNIFDEISIKIREKNHKLLSNVQYFARNKILERKNIVFAAPTSFGKSSIVIDTISELINSNKIKKVLFLLPTKALINEYRRKIKKIIKDITIIENPHITVDFSKVIYLYTPERFLVFYENNKNIKIDYVVNDEAQILININKKKCVGRSILLAKTLSIISENKTPIIFLLPYVSKPYDTFIFKYINIAKEDIIQISDDMLPFVSNNYYILDVDETGDLFKYDFSKDAGLELANKKYIASASDSFKKEKLEDWGNIIVDNLDKIINIDKKFIIFCTNKNTIKSVAHRLIKNETCKIDVISYRMQALINYIETNIGSEFEFINFLKNGIAVHFSEIDSYIRRQIEIIFNEENDIKGLICTSTLLQGVNLNAQNLIMIYGNKFSAVGNVDIDYRNLIGRSARLGINIQGNIYNIACNKKIEKEGEKLYSSSEPAKINFDKVIYDVKKEPNEIIKTYAMDSQVKSKLKDELNSGQEKHIENLDYFIGNDSAEKVSKKINAGNIDYYVDLLKNIGNYEKTLLLIQELSRIYEWKDSSNFDVSKRMMNFEYITRLAISVFNGENVRTMINQSINFVQKNHEYILVVCKNIREAEYVRMIHVRNMDLHNMRLFNRERDINTYIYTMLYDIQNIIEFHLKKYIQDLYYRIKAINKDTILEVEEILDYSTKDKKKISLNNIGIVDGFAISLLTKEEFADFYDSEDNIKVEMLKEYAKNLSDDDPIKYAILDVI